jgi:hypothetical protein
MLFQIQTTFSLVLALLTLPSPTVSWTYSTYVDLAWPPLEHREYETMNSHVVGTHGDNDPIFPCGNVPVRPDQKRVPFPTVGGHIQMNQVNDTGALAEHNYLVIPYFGQISGDTSLGENKTRNIGSYVFKNFSTGPDCTPEEYRGDYPFNNTKVISLAIASWPDQPEDGPMLDIVGWNATLGLRVVLFNDDSTAEKGPVYNVESEIQCAYVTFVTPEEFANYTSSGGGGYCDSKTRDSASSGGSKASPSPTIGGGVLPTSRMVGISSSTPVPSGINPSGSPNSQSHKKRDTSIGIGIGAVVGLAFIIFAMYGLRHRKVNPKFASGTFLGLGTTKGSSKDKTDKGKAAVENGDTESVKSEALPTYEQALDDDVVKVAAEEKKDYKVTEGRSSGKA